MSVNASSLLTLNPIIVYLTLGLYGLLFAFIFAYLHGRLRTSNRMLAMLKKDWAAADSQHKGLLQDAQNQLATLSIEAPSASSSPAASNVTLDTRKQVIAMSKKGFTVTEISRTCGLPEGEVDVLLSISRMQR